MKPNLFPENLKVRPSINSHHCCESALAVATADDIISNSYHQEIIAAILCAGKVASPRSSSNIGGRDTFPLGQEMWAGRVQFFER
jgi:hypothetical protein